MTIDEAGRLAMDLLAKYGLRDWQFGIGKLPSQYWGETDLDEKLITISDACPDHEIREAILHEIAHALVPDDFDHGYAWQDKARELGCQREDYFAEYYLSPNYPCRCDCVH